MGLYASGSGRRDFPCAVGSRSVHIGRRLCLKYVTAPSRRGSSARSARTVLDERVHGNARREGPTNLGAGEHCAAVAAVGHARAGRAARFVLLRVKSRPAAQGAGGGGKGRAGRTRFESKRTDALPLARLWSPNLRKRLPSLPHCASSQVRGCPLCGLGSVRGTAHAGRLPRTETATRLGRRSDRAESSLWSENRQDRSAALSQGATRVAARGAFEVLGFDPVYVANVELIRHRAAGTRRCGSPCLGPFAWLPADRPQPV